MVLKGVEGVQRNANKAAASGQKEGAKGSMAAMKVQFWRCSVKPGKHCESRM